MNEMKLVEDFCAAEPPPPPQRLAQVRAKVTDSIGGIGLPGSGPARGRPRRLRLALSGAGTVGVALAVGLALELPSGGPGSTGLSAGARPVHVHLAAWSVDSGLAGTVTLTLREMQDPARLRSVLAEAGVPAIIHFGELCISTHEPQPAAPFFKFSRPRYPGEPLAFTIFPSALPKGSQLDISIAPMSTTPGIRAFRIDLVSVGGPLNCSAPGRGEAARS
jgi:hypothetical protein